MSTSLHGAVKAYHNLIPKLKGSAFDDNRMDSLSTTRRTLSAKRSARLMTSRESSSHLSTEHNTLRSFRNHSSLAVPQGYYHSISKTEIDEEYHQKYKQNLVNFLLH